MSASQITSYALPTCISSDSSNFDDGQIKITVDIQLLDSQFLELKNKLQQWKSGRVAPGSADFDDALHLLERLYFAFKIDQEAKVRMGNEILELRQKVTKLEGIIGHMQVQLNQMQAKNDNMQAQNDNMQAQIDQIQADKEYSKYFIALQDLNALYSLEKSMPNTSSKKNFAKLRQNRNGGAHCIFDEDYEELKQYKTVSILDRLDSMSPACVQKFASRFDSLFINAVKTHFLNFSISGSILSDDKEIADDWWTDN